MSIKEDVSRYRHQVNGKYAMRQLSPVLRVVGVENVRRQVVARATLTQRCGYTEEDVSKIAVWGEGRGRWTSVLGKGDSVCAPGSGAPWGSAGSGAQGRWVSLSRAENPLESLQLFPP